MHSSLASLLLLVAGAPLARANGFRQYGHNNASSLVSPRLSSSSFDLAGAKRWVYLANAAYCSQSALESWSCGDNCAAGVAASAVVFVAESLLSLQGYVAFDATSGTVVVAFRGTEDVENWIENIDFIKTSPYSDFPTAEVHQGFYEDWRALAADVESAIATARAAGGDAAAPLTVVGHSLGGALAALAAFDLARDGYSVSEVWTAGSPRVGNSNFASAFETVFARGENTRLTHYHDIVPHVPEEALGFHHVAGEVWLDEANDAATVCDGSGEDGACSNSCSPFSCTSVDDHLDYIGVPMGSGSC